MWPNEEASMASCKADFEYWVIIERTVMAAALPKLTNPTAATSRTQRGTHISRSTILTIRTTYQRTRL